LSGEEARVAHVVLYTYAYIDRWIDAREDREREREGGRDAERKMGLREDAAESRMKKKVEEAR